VPTRFHRRIIETITMFHEREFAGIRFDMQPFDRVGTSALRGPAHPTLSAYTISSWPGGIDLRYR